MHLVSNILNAIQEFDNYVSEIMKHEEPFYANPGELVPEYTRSVRNQWEQIGDIVFQNYIELIKFATEECQAAIMDDEQLYQVVDGLDNLTVYGFIQDRLREIGCENLHHGSYMLQHGVYYSRNQA